MSDADDDDVLETVFTLTSAVSAAALISSFADVRQIPS